MLSNASRPIVVDDTDIQVRYTGQGWFRDAGSQDQLGNFGPTYNHTLHGTNSNGSFSFAFHGTSIHVYGTTNFQNTTGTIDPSCECFVDKISIGATKPSFSNQENNELLCEQKDITDGAHEITVNVTSHGQIFWFDYLQYTLSPGVSLDTAVFLVDNADPDIRYGPGWGGLADTANMTNLTGSHMYFNFTGTRLVWLGLIPTEYSHNASSGTFSVDGGTPELFILHGLPTGNDAQTKFNEVFFTTSLLPAGAHTLIVTYNGTGQQTPLTLDHMFITNTPTQKDPVTLYTISWSHYPDKRGPSVGAIIGAVIGGLVLVALALFLFWWCKRGKNNEKDPIGIAVRPMEATPFMSSYAQQVSMAGNHKTNLGHQPWPSVTDPSQQAPANTFSQRKGVPRSQHNVRPLVPVYGQPSLAIHGGNGQSSSGPALSGYNNEAVTQRNETAAESAQRRMLQQDGGVHQERNASAEDRLPDYTPN